MKILKLDSPEMHWFYEGYDPECEWGKRGRVLANDARASIIYEPNASPANPEIEYIAKFIAAAPELARMLKRYVEADDTCEGGGWELENAFWLNIKRQSAALLKSLGVEVDAPKVLAVIPEL